MLLLLFDYIGTLAFAASGALKGIRRDMDIFGVAVLATVTAIGGGTIRDALLDLPVFWLGNSTYVLISVATALMVFLLYRLVERTERILLVFDAIGLGVFTAIGAMKAGAAGMSIVGIVTMGLLTGIGGGVIRDVLSREIPVVLREEVYASASIAGGLIYALLTRVEVLETVAVGTAIAVTIAIRLMSIWFGWQLPRPVQAGGPPGRNQC